MTKGGGVVKKKDALSLDELQVLAKTETQNKQVKQAFLFSCFTSLRWCDVKQLHWKDIDMDAKTMAVLQEKTNVRVFVPLNEAALNLLGNKEHLKDFVFALPSANGANKTLKAWVKRAGITKEITWHR